MSDSMRQEAPWPAELVDLVAKLELEPGWHITLEDKDRGQGSRGLTLVILTETFDTFRPEAGRVYRVWHYFIVPAASYNRRTWERWLFDRYCDVLIHEAGEWFKVDGFRPMAPHHGDGEDPYTVFHRDRGDTTEARRRPGDGS